MLSRILNARTNVIGTAVIAVSSSLLMAFIVLSTSHRNEARTSTRSLVPASSPSVLDCGENVYSPVQRKCVSHDVFDDEMKRLFAALGIEAAVYSNADDTQ